MRPSQPGSRPSSYWAWDFLPLFASTHAYQGRNDDKLQPDKALIFRLYLDDNFRKGSDLRARTKNEGEPDPLEMSEMSGKAVVEVTLYHCLQESDWDLVKKAFSPTRPLSSQEKPNVRHLKSAPCKSRSPSSLLTRIALPIGSKR